MGSNPSDTNSQDVYRLAAAKRAISNFVNIVTGQAIPVKFRGKNSYTDGKSVVIGANVTEPADFDVAVGLALHEGSHIKLTDFSVWEDVPSYISSATIRNAIDRGVHDSVAVVRNLCNVVEDRRIDSFIFRTAPGYRDYYRVLYDKYFNDPLIDKALQSDEYTDETLESYMFRIINIANPNSDASKLNGLPAIFKTIGLNKIDRLKSTTDSLNVAIEVFKIILQNIPDGGVGSKNNPMQIESSNSQTDDASQELSDKEFENLMNNLESGDSGESESGDGSGSGNMVSSGITPGNSKSGVKLTDKQIEKLSKLIQKQEKFLNGDIDKKKVSQNVIDDVKQIEESGTEMVKVGASVSSSRKLGGVFNKGGIDCIVVKKLTREMMQSRMFPLVSHTWQQGMKEVKKECEAEVLTGIQLGTILGKQLQVRSEQRTTVYNQQRHGKIDKRAIHSLGFGNESVFQTTEVDFYKKANLHVSLDASGSMAGARWKQTMIAVVSLCKAVDMIPNLDIQVSIRTTSDARPYVVLAYDSRKDKFTKVRQLFPYLQPTGTTPEGLCYEAIMKNFIPSNNDMDSYFLNISDGEPCFDGKDFNYSNEPAFNHTRGMVKQMEAKGIKTLSYYVSDYVPRNGKPSDDFIKMYGTSARAIDVKSVNQVVKTMNELFLKK